MANVIEVVDQESGAVVATLPVEKYGKVSWASEDLIAEWGLAEMERVLITSVEANARAAGYSLVTDSGAVAWDDTLPNRRATDSVLTVLSHVDDMPVRVAMVTVRGVRLPDGITPDVHETRFLS